jgi:hypothetical protein
MFQRCVTTASYRCCKSKSGCCICCNGYTRMLQMSVPNVSSVFLDISCKCVYLDVACVLHICCTCFIWMLHMLAMAFKCFSGVSQVFQTYVVNVSSVSDVCYKYFI